MVSYKIGPEEIANYKAINGRCLNIYFLVHKFSCIIYLVTIFRNEAVNRLKLYNLQLLFSVDFDNTEFISMTILKLDFHS